MLIGLYGGTFDPVHNGHMHAAQSVLEACDLSQIRWVLAARPGHRGAPGASLEHRWQMLTALCATHRHFEADATEIEHPGTSFTFNTLATVRSQNTSAVPCWILGLDAYATLDSWYRWQELLDVCNLLVVARPGQQAVLPDAVQVLDQAHSTPSLQRDRTGQILHLDLPMLEASATEVRRRVAAGVDYDHLLIPPVSTYIKEHNLYTEKVA